MLELAVEVADFGYGPARAVVATMEDALDEVHLTIYTCGNALDLLRAAMPWATFRELSTIDPSCWRTFANEVAAETAVLTMSGQFARWARDKGYWVVLIDQLDWMWLERPSFDPPLGLHLVPAYFGPQGSQSPGATAVAPLAASYFRKPQLPPNERRDVTIGLGGMSTAGRPDAADDYAAWLLRHCVPLLAERPEVDTIHVVGGSEALPSLLPRGQAGVEMQAHVALAPRKYAELLARSAHLVMSPGLGAICELSRMEVEAFFLPGDAMSTLLQLDDLHSSGYRHVGLWPWHADLCSRIRSMEQTLALALIEPLVHRCVSADGRPDWMLRSLVGYLERDRTADRPCVTFPIGLPDGSALIRGALRKRTGSAPA